MACRERNRDVRREKEGAALLAFGPVGPSIGLAIADCFDDQTNLYKTITMVGFKIFRWMAHGSLGISTPILLSVLGTGAPVSAEVRVEGTVAAIRVTANKDAISDVLAALGATFNVRYHTLVPLDRVTSDTYSGSFGQVISRLPDGYNYVIAHYQDTVEIIVLTERGEPFTPPVLKPDASTKSIPATSTKSIPAPWR